MKKSVSYVLLLAVFYFSCSNSNNGGSSRREAKGDRVYGGVLRVNENEKCQSLYPLSIIEMGTSHVASQVLEGLVKFNAKDLSIIPGIAEKWDIDAAGTTYTFHLKKGVMFHDDPCFPDGKGREVKASDFKYSFELLCTDSKENLAFGATFQDHVVGANEFFKTNKGTPNGNLEGVKVADDYTLIIKLISPSSSFLYALANPLTSVMAKEAVEKYGTDMKVGTGPFVYSSNSTEDKVILTRNNNYHQFDSLGNRLPFLDSVIFSFIPVKKQELEAFQNDQLDIIVGLPSESIKDIVETQISDFQGRPPKYVLERLPEMASQYYAFNMTKAPFNDIKVRKAFSYAIDRTKIVDEVLKGEAYGPGINGICPPSFKGYDITKITGYTYDPEKAKNLLKEAGYPGGKGFPKIKIELHSGGSINTNVVLDIQKQLMEVLNINVDFEVVPKKQKLEDAKFGRAEIFQSFWIADFPSPENFLWLLYGGSVPSDVNAPSFPNTSRYKNPAYDKLFEEGQAAKTEGESFNTFLKAEQLMMDDAPIMVLWYDENYRLVKANVHNYNANPMRYTDFSAVYLKDMSASSNNVAETKKEEK